MGTSQDHRPTQAKVSNKPPICAVCFKEYTPECDWRQGRCPHHPSMIDQILDNPYKSRFLNLLRWAGWKK